MGDTEHLDVLVVGAGISGVAAGYHLQTQCPRQSYAILESRGSIGGTWDLFRYPGVRSDSDMYTLGFRFRPWPDPKTIADGPAILKYVRETACEYGIDSKIRFNHRVVSAQWSSEESLWTVEALRTDTEETVRFTCGFLFMCSGYYRYDEGFTPDFEGRERFRGPIIHPQHWDDELDYTGKRVVVIGSGASAVTLVPALAERAGHVTMLQRSPSYIVSLPAEDPLARLLRRILPARLAYAVLRWKNVAMTSGSFALSRRRPKLAKALIRKGVERQLPAGYDIDTHFKPNYNPWDQRMCLVPDADLFKVISSGGASMVTDRIKTFTEDGIELESGEKLEADVIVTATGLNMLVFGGLEISVDGEPVDVSKTMGYKGLMLSGVPNAAAALGYTNASWTLKCELTCEYVCRLLNYMDSHGYRKVVPVNRDPTVTPEPFIDFSSGYILRSIDKFPKQGSKHPWRLYQNYPRDILTLRYGEIDDEALEFSGGVPAPAPAELAAHH
jgi:monooxygenase